MSASPQFLKLRHAAHIRLSPESNCTVFSKITRLLVRRFLSTYCIVFSKRDGEEKWWEEKHVPRGQTKANRVDGGRWVHGGWRIDRRGVSDSEFSSTGGRWGARERTRGCAGPLYHQVCCLCLRRWRACDYYHGVIDGKKFVASCSGVWCVEDCCWREDTKESRINYEKTGGGICFRACTLIKVPNVRSPADRPPPGFL